MSKNNQIDLIEFPTSSAKEVKAVAKFFNSVFGWNRGLPTQPVNSWQFGQTSKAA